LQADPDPRLVVYAKAQILLYSYLEAHAMWHVWLACGQCSRDPSQLVC